MAEDIESSLVECFASAGCPGPRGEGRNSRMPVVGVVWDKPVVSATRVSPPRYRAEASAAAPCRRMRSVTVGDNNSNVARHLSRMPMVARAPR
jgi:hypothetical protein